MRSVLLQPNPIPDLELGWVLGPRFPDFQISVCVLLSRLAVTEALHMKTRDHLLCEIVLFNVPLRQLIGNHVGSVIRPTLPIRMGR